MREYKFRGKRLADRQWVYGNLLTYFNSPAIQDYSHTNGEIFRVDHETVGQYTGLKDKNGTGDKEVYEADIIKTKHGKIYKVAWLHTHCSFAGVSLDNPETNDWIPLGFTYFEVIGNIYEDKYLLKEE